MSSNLVGEFESKEAINTRTFSRLILISEDKVVLFLRNDLGVTISQELVGKYEIPGGELEVFDIDLRYTAVRELEEETEIILPSNGLEYFISTKARSESTIYLTHFWYVSIEAFLLEREDVLLISSENISDVDPNDLIFDHFDIVSTFLRRKEM